MVVRMEEGWRWGAFDGEATVSDAGARWSQSSERFRGRLVAMLVT